MPETKPALKIDFQNLGLIRLMPLDTANLFLPFGRPVADYIRDGDFRASRHPALDFSIPVAWQESLAALVRATGVDTGGSGESAEAESPAGAGNPLPAATEAEPAEREPRQASFLTLSLHQVAPRDTGAHAKTEGAAVPPSPVRLPSAEAVPLRSRIKLAAAPQAKQRETPREKETVKEAPLKSAPTAKTPAITVAKPPASGPVKAPAAPALKTPSVAKPVVAPPAPPRPAPPPDKAVEARKEEHLVKEREPAAKDVAKPALPAKTAPVEETPAATAVSRPATVKPSVPAAAATASKPPAISPPARPAPSPQAKPGRPEAVTRAEVKEEVVSTPLPTGESKPQPPAPTPAMEPRLHFGGAADGDELEGGFLARIPAGAKVGVSGLVVLAAAGYFLLGWSKTENPAPLAAVASNATGAQGWVTEWASDTVGSRRARQLQLYRPSMTLSDYRLEFTGTIESKALGWVFRATDTKNYYVMKIETLRPGSYQLTRFAVVDGRESSDSSKPLPVAVSGNAFQVRLDVQGPRYTAYVQGQPVDFWTDNRLKSGAVGFINERDERAVTTSVRFSTQGGAK